MLRTSAFLYEDKKTGPRLRGPMEPLFPSKLDDFWRGGWAFGAGAAGDGGTGEVVGSPGDGIHRLLFTGALAVVGIDTEGHIRGAVSGQVLHLLQVVASLEKLGDIGMPQLMGVAGEVEGDGGLAVFAALDGGAEGPILGSSAHGDAAPQRLEAAFRQAAAIPGTEDIGRAGPGALLQQDFAEQWGNGEGPPGRVALQQLCDGHIGDPLGERLVMGDVDLVGVEVDVLPHEAQDLAPTHPSGEGHQAEEVGTGALDRLEQTAGLVIGEGIRALDPGSADRLYVRPDGGF